MPNTLKRSISGIFVVALAALATGCGLVIPPLPESSTSSFPQIEPKPDESTQDTGPLTVEFSVEPASTDDFKLQVLTTGLDQPWEIVHGPDGYLWLTERMGKQVLRVNPADGQLSIAIVMDDVYANLSQEGLLGMVLHPELNQRTGNDYVYVAYTYSPRNGEETRAKIRRYRYQVADDSRTGSLVEPVDLLTNLPASTDHNGGRLAFGDDMKIYYSTGDQGAGNFTNLCLPNDAQTVPTLAEIMASDWRHYVGKILRLNLDGTIPTDNPVWNDVQSHVFSVGHRNPHGLVMGNGQIYATEHGPKSDDEVNRIIGGRNYGWPYVSGYQDDQSYVYADWSAATTPCETLEFNEYAIPATVPLHQESESNNPAFMPPLHTFGTVSNGYNFAQEACAPAFFICWPTVAPTGMDFYAAAEYSELGGGIPGWTDSLLVAALKTGTIYRLPLEPDGGASVGRPQPIFKTTNRYRDLTISPDGRTVYVITDSQGSTQDSSGYPTNSLEHSGAILVFTYVGGN